MKNLILITALVFGLVACNSNTKTENSEQNVEKTTAATDIPTYELDSLLSVADQMVDKTVKVRGYVTHTCKHAGKRCFITGESQNASMRVEAKGEIGGFNRELAGSKLEITGILKERKLTKEYIEQTEVETLEKQKKEDGSAESCQAELNNINEMKEWMKEHGKDYYSIYFMDGENYEVLN